MASCIKVCFLGRNNSGKTCIILRLTRNIFENNYIPTVQNLFQKTIFYNNSTNQLLIVDTSGQEDIDNSTCAAIHSCEIFILVYSITSKISFDALKEYKSKIDELKSVDDPIIILVGSKIDLDENREVPSDLGRSLASEWGASFYELSSKSGSQAVEDIFYHVVEKIRNERNSQNQANGCCSIF